MGFKEAVDDFLGTNKQKYYYANASCSNCEHKGQVKVPAGMTLKEFFDEGVCPKCECPTLTGKATGKRVIRNDNSFIA